MPANPYLQEAEAADFFGQSHSPRMQKLLGFLGGGGDEAMGTSEVSEFASGEAEKFYHERDDLQIPMERFSPELFDSPEDYEAGLSYMNRLGRYTPEQVEQRQMEEQQRSEAEEATRVPWYSPGRLFHGEDWVKEKELKNRIDAGLATQEDVLEWHRIQADRLAQAEAAQRSGGFQGVMGRLALSPTAQGFMTGASRVYGLEPPGIAAVDAQKEGNTLAGLSEMGGTAAAMMGPLGLMRGAGRALGLLGTPTTRIGQAAEMGGLMGAYEAGRTVLGATREPTLGEVGTAGGIGMAMGAAMPFAEPLVGQAAKTMRKLGFDFGALERPAVIARGTPGQRTAVSQVQQYRPGSLDPIKHAATGMVEGAVGLGLMTALHKGEPIENIGDELLYGGLVDALMTVMGARSPFLTDMARRRVQVDTNEVVKRLDRESVYSVAKDIQDVTRDGRLLDPKEKARLVERLRARAPDNEALQRLADVIDAPDPKALLGPGSPQPGRGVDEPPLPGGEPRVGRMHPFIGRRLPGPTDAEQRAGRRWLVDDLEAIGDDRPESPDPQTRRILGEVDRHDVQTRVMEAAEELASGRGRRIGNVERVRDRMERAREVARMPTREVRSEGMREADEPFAPGRVFRFPDEEVVTTRRPRGELMERGAEALGMPRPKPVEEPPPVRARARGEDAGQREEFLRGRGTAALRLPDPQNRLRRPPPPPEPGPPTRPSTAPPFRPRAPEEARGRPVKTQRQRAKLSEIYRQAKDTAPGDAQRWNILGMRAMERATVRDARTLLRRFGATKKEASAVRTRAQFRKVWKMLGAKRSVRKGPSGDVRRDAGGRPGRVSYGKTPEEVEAVVRAAVKSMAPRARFGFEKGEIPIVGARGPTTRGAYLARHYGRPEDPKSPSNLLAVSLKIADDPLRTGRHEVVHHLRHFGLFTESEWNLLSERSDQSWMKQYDIEGRYPHLPKSERLEEGIAEGFAHWMAGDHVVDGATRKVFEKMKNFFARIRNALRGMGFRTVDDIFKAVEAGTVGSRKALAGPARLIATLSKTDASRIPKPKRVEPLVLEDRAKPGLSPEAYLKLEERRRNGEGGFIAYDDFARGMGARLDDLTYLLSRAYQVGYNVVKTPVGLVARTAIGPVKLFLPTRVTKRVQDAFRGGKLARFLERPFADEAVPDVESGAAIMWTLAVRSGVTVDWDKRTGAMIIKDQPVRASGTVAAAIMKMFEDPERVFGEHVVAPVDEMYRNIDRWMRSEQAKLYGDNSPLNRLASLHGYKPKRATPRVVRRWKFNEPKYKASLTRVMQALERGAWARKEGEEYVKEWASRDDLTPEELAVHDQMRETYDSFRAAFAKHYGKRPEDWGMEDYFAHIWDNSPVSERTFPGAKRDELMPRKGKFGPTFSREKWREDYIKDPEEVINKYIPGAIFKMEHDKMVDRINEVVWGHWKPARGSANLFRAIRKRLIPTTDMGAQANYVRVKIPSESDKTWRWMEFVSASDRKGTVTLRGEKGLVTYHREQFDRPPQKLKTRAERAEWRKSHPRVYLRFRQAARTRDGRTVGMWHILRSYGESGREELLRRWIRDVTSPTEANRIEKAVAFQARLLYQASLGMLSPKAVMMNKLQEFTTMAEVGFSNWILGRMAISRVFDLGVEGGDAKEWFKSKLGVRGMKGITRAEMKTMFDEVLGRTTTIALMDDLHQAIRRTGTMDPKVGPKGVGNRLALAFEKAESVGSLGWNWSEYDNQLSAAAAAYIKGRRRGWDEKKSRNYAREMVRKTQGIYRRASTPDLFRSRYDTEFATMKNVAKKTFLMFKRWSSLFTVGMSRAANESVRWSLANGRRIPEHLMPIAPKGVVDADAPIPGSRAFKAMEADKQAESRKLWQSRTKREKDALFSYHTKLRRLEKFQGKEWVSKEWAQRADAELIYRRILTILAVIELGDMLEQDWGMGTMVDSPLNAYRTIKETYERGTVGFIDSQTPPMVRVAVDLGKALAAWQDGVTAGFDWNVNTKQAEQNWKVVENYLGNAKWIFRYGFGRLYGDTKLLEKMSPDMLEHDPEKPWAFYGMDRLENAGAQPVYRASAPEMLRKVLVPGRFQGEVERQEFLVEAQKIQRQSIMRQRAMDVHWHNHLEAMRKGEKERAAEEMGKVMTLARGGVRLPSPGTLRQQARYRPLDLIAKKVLSGTMDARVRKLDRLLEAYQNSPHVVTWNSVVRVVAEVLSSRLIGEADHEAVQRIVERFTELNQARKAHREVAQR